MDVEMQMEANGLPSQFGSTADQPPESSITSNVDVDVNMTSSKNSEAVALKQSISPLPEPVEPPVPEPEIPRLPDSIPTTNGLSHDAPINHIEVATSTPSLIPDSQPLPVVEEPEPALQVESASTSIPPAVPEPVIPSSIPPEVPSTDTTTETAEIVVPTPPTQAPISDLRSEPHADNLTPAEVLQVEAEKHQLDNEAEPTPASPPEPLTISSEPTALPPVTSLLQEPVTNIGLATPPTQSPPPAPHPAPASLPVEAPVLPSAEPIQAEAPVEKPVEPAPTPAIPAPALTNDAEDQEMTDANSPTIKVARDREEEEESAEPAAKRVKTEDTPQENTQTEFKVPDTPTAGPTNGLATTGAADDQVTAPRLAHMKKIISNLKKSNASTAFRLPVDPVALNIPTYLDVVKQPMDLSIIDNKLKQSQYTSIADFVNDFELIVGNCEKFNGREHGVTQQAYKMQSSFNNQMLNLPKANAEELSKEQKKLAKLKQEPTRTAPPRRPSVSTPTAPAPAPVGTAKSPKTAPPTPSFAVGPDGVPTIRRDSTNVDGRPKRAIVPPKRNQEFAGGRPKKKKYELQLKFCQEALKEISSPKHWQKNQYFTHPVDPVALNIPTYFQIIRKPMDLGTVQTKLDSNVYEKAKDFEEDVRLVFKNCYKFNPEGDYVNQCGHELEELFNKKWATKDEWIASREPVSEPQSDGEEEEEDESDGADSDDERRAQIELLQKQMLEMSKQVAVLSQQTSKPKSKSPPARKGSKSKSSKKDKSGATFPNLNKKKEKKPSTSKSKDKDRYVTFAEKQYISNGIAMLPEKQMQDALKIIQNSVPSLANSDQNEIELDIEEVPNHALLKLLNFVKKYAGPPPDEPKPESDSFAAPAVSKSKKNKPMSKQEQEAQIAELKGKIGAYAGPVSPTAVQSVETGDDSSDDDGDSEESEEE